MAKRKRNNPQIPSSTNRFDKGMTTDIRDYHLPENAWTHARNAINNSHIGDLGGIGNEPANGFCTNAPYTIIGTIHREGTLWSIYSTNNVDSEIGTFDESDCSYTKIVNDPCLNFKTTHLIKGVSRPTFDCSFRDYWADGLNPDRTMDVNNVPWVQECETVNGCTTCEDTTVLDCDKIRLESFIENPCVEIKKGPSAGSILNGSYYVMIAYTVNQQRVTDYFTMSNVLSVFDHDNVNSSLDIIITNLDLNFSEYELLVVSTVAEKTVAKIIGLYSTHQTNITLDFIDPSLPAVALNDLAIRNPIVDKSEGIYNSGKYLFRVGLTSKFDFNYQPLANQIIAKWQCVEYPKEYYKNGGTNVGHMRDEVYPYFIRWVYNTGDKSNSYHIPGRGVRLYNLPGGGSALENDDYLTTENNNLEDLEGLTSKVFEMYNTASVTSTPNTVLNDGGILIAEGDMGYHESSELYDDKKPEVWNSNVSGRPDWDLCGQPIRHHKFPENTIYEASASSDITNHYTSGGNSIRVLGVAFENIQVPVDNYGNPITNIVGYEILRGSRNGNKTVLYKGMINNMFEYDIPNSISSRTGLYSNYPYNDLNPDKFISKTETHYETIGGVLDLDPNDTYSKKHFTFHSPDTMFNKPFLSQKEIKMYGVIHGITEGSYVEVDGHPKHKFVTDVTFALGVTLGVGHAITKVIGKSDINYVGPSHYMEPIFAGSGSNSVGTPLGGPIASGFQAANLLVSNAVPGLGLLEAISGIPAVEASLYTSVGLQTLVPAGGVNAGHIDMIYRDRSNLPNILSILQAPFMFASNVAEGADLLMDIIRKVSKWRQFALQYQSHCGYESFYKPDISNKRRYINDLRYLDSHIQDYGLTHKVNNLYRNKTVMFDTSVDIDNVPSNIVDNSRPPLVSSLSNNDPFQNITGRRASSHYVGIKNRLRNQYGQLQSIIQLPVSTCVIPKAQSSTGTLFGGDTYIGRYQEKNTLYYFYKWLMGEPNGEELDYHKLDMIKHTSFWMDTEPFDTGEFTSSLGPAVQSAFTSGSFSAFFQNLVTPSDKHCFDRLSNSNGFFMVKNAFMYLFSSGVRDFFVESELNIDYRDHAGTEATMHWDVMKDYKALFRGNIIKAGNYYKLDRSLSVSYLPFSKVSWGNLQDRDYSPLLSETCYTEFPRRLVYSLPQNTLAKQDNWSVFLANNYQDFNSKIVNIKPINSTGAIILFENEAPGLFPGVDELQLKSGTSITVGDGGLFAREMQRLSNTDKPYEYGSCQSRLSVINTPAGLFYMNLDQGKVFRYANGLQEISLKNNQYWFNQYLPYALLKDFPEYDVLDNPVAGIGCQSIYDAEWGIVYFCKKDYRLKKSFENRVTYKGDGKFLVDGILTVNTGDSRYFDNASWTISYDPKQDEEISWHDWHPNLTLPSTNSFLTTKGKGLWRHNTRCDKYCNYYGINYPFEIEFQIDNLPAVTILRNVEYYLQAFIYDENCRDRFHVLDFNFDEAVVYNSEQCSGLLRMNLTPKNDVTLLDSYPKVTLNGIDILYSKEEQKYRFNQFWDVTKDRGEFSPLVSESIWKTEPNGYIRNLNPLNLNYTKAEFERKKIRHYNNKILLIRKVSDNKKIIVTMTNVKLLNSPR